MMTLVHEYTFRITERNPPVTGVFPVIHELIAFDPFCSVFCPHELTVWKSPLAKMLLATERIYSARQKTNP